MASLNSEAVLGERLNAAGFTADEQTRMRQQGLTTLARVAFCCAYQPGGDEGPLLTAAKTIFGEPVQGSTMVSFRMLHFEAFTIMASDMRQRITRTDDSTPQRLPAAERQARIDRQKQRLIGLELRDELEPSHALVDAAVQIYEDNCWGYLSWEVCTRRSQEIAGVRKDQAFRLDPSTGSLKLQDAAHGPQAELVSDLMIKNALSRRGLAFDQASIMSFAMHERWVSKLFRHYTSVTPVGYSGVSYEQLRRADVALFTKLIDQTRGRVRPDNTGAIPADAEMPSIMNDPEVVFMLLPLPSGSAQKRPAVVPPEGPLTPDKKLKKEPKGKGKGKGKDGKRVNMPSGLRGMHSRTPATHATNPDEPLCFSYSLPGGCQRPTTGDPPKCAKGLHLCCKPRCYEKHPLPACTKP